MKIHWYGHAAFHITTDKGTRIIIDPYQAGAFDGALSYGKITDGADIVITSHDHADHNYIKDIPGTYTHIHKAGTTALGDVDIKTIPAFHDPSQGKERGKNLITVIKADGLTLVHTGDLGHRLDADTLKGIGEVDVLLLPVGGFFTIDAAAAANVMDDIRPAVTIPMHYKTDKCAFPIAPVENFIGGRKNVRVLKESSFSISKDSRPKEPEIVVLTFSR